MELTKRSYLVYGLLLGVWTLVVAWQVEEHIHLVRPRSSFHETEFAQLGRECR